MKLVAVADPDADAWIDALASTMVIPPPASDSGVSDIALKPSI